MRTPRVSLLIGASVGQKIQPLHPTQTVTRSHWPAHLSRLGGVCRPRGSPGEGIRSYTGSSPTCLNELGIRIGTDRRVIRIGTDRKPRSCSSCPTPTPHPEEPQAAPMVPPQAFPRSSSAQAPPGVQKLTGLDTEKAHLAGKGGRTKWQRGKRWEGERGGRKEERAKLAETSRAARPSRGHPASWQRLPVTSWQGCGDGEAGGRGACKTLESLFI